MNGFAYETRMLNREKCQIALFTQDIVVILMIIIFNN